MSNSTKQIQAAQSTRDLKTRILTALHRLSDRDTQSSAASELESIAATALTPSTIPIFISSAITATSSSDTPSARRHCIRLVSVISRHHPPHILSSHLQKLLTAVLRRLRDQDSSIRSTAASAVADLASSGHHPFSTLTKPFFEALFTDPDPNAQSGAALCLVRITEEAERNKTGFSTADVAGLRRVLVKLEKLVRNEGFKGKTSALLVVGSVVGVAGVVVSGGATKGLIGWLVGFLGSEDWTVRKAAAEALWRLAAVGVAEDKGILSEFKASCLKTFDAKRFDKVKGVRETMNHMIEAWKDIPDLAGELSQAFSITSVASNATQLKNNTHPRLNESSPLSTARKRSPLSATEKRKEPAMFRKLDRKKPSFSKPEIAAAPNRTPQTVVSECSSPLVDDDDDYHEEKTATPEIKRECEDLSHIRKQLVKIENQQSSLLDILQKFVGSSQNGMHSLERRVHGLEVALDEISFDLAVATGKLSENSAVCCSFLSPKLWRKPEGTSPSIRNGEAEQFPRQSRRYNFRGGSEIIKNPLAEIPRGISSAERANRIVV